MADNEVDSNYSKNISLIIDALFLANRLTVKAKQAEGTEEFKHIMRVAGKAWKRYDRRALLVDGIKQVGAK